MKLIQIFLHSLCSITVSHGGLVKQINPYLQQIKSVHILILSWNFKKGNKQTHSCLKGRNSLETLYTFMSWYRNKIHTIWSWYTNFKCPFNSVNLYYQVLLCRILACQYPNINLLLFSICFMWYLDATTGLMPLCFIYMLCSPKCLHFPSLITF